jgi:signal peptidase I
MKLARTFLYFLVFLTTAYFVVKFSFRLETFSVRNASMAPAIEVGDRIVAAKPLACVFSRCQPGRGEIWAYMTPLYNGIQVKRVVGLPGDSIQMVNGMLVINGEPITKSEVPDAGGGAVARRWLESVDGREYEVLSDPERSVHVALRFGRYSVPEGRYFVLGDNRDESTDSRLYIERYRFVRQDQLVGRVQGVWLRADRGLTWLALNK